jgi:tRNA G37 N-methylase Trm5
MQVAARVTPHNLDARAFLTQVVRPLVEAVGGRGVQHVVMNLPASAIDFLGLRAAVPRTDRPSPYRL